MLSYLLVVMVLGSVQPTPNPLCDPQTEYAENGQCCRMCAPGKRMTSVLSCSNPVCEDCEDGEYQDNYNKEEKCKRQPYCDPNKNFELTVHQSKKEKTTCLCNQGYHCSSEQCITCVLHTTCQPGEEVLLEGNQTQDTVCRPCPEKTFSNTSNSKCVKWTECTESFHVKQNGSSRSDTVCEKNSRDHLIIGVVAGCAVIVAVLVFLVYKCLNKSRYGSEKLFENGHVETVGPEPSHLIGIPEENDVADMLSFEDHTITENGNCLAQEDGKPDRLSRQESQSHPSSHFDSSF